MILHMRVRWYLNRRHTAQGARYCIWFKFYFKDTAFQSCTRITSHTCRWCWAWAVSLGVVLWAYRCPKTLCCWETLRRWRRLFPTALRTLERSHIWRDAITREVVATCSRSTEHTTALSLSLSFSLSLSLFYLFSFSLFVSVSPSVSFPSPPPSLSLSSHAI